MNHQVVPLELIKKCGIFTQWNAQNSIFYMIPFMKLVGWVERDMGKLSRILGVFNILPCRYNCQNPLCWSLRILKILLYVNYVRREGGRRREGGGRREGERAGSQAGRHMVWSENPGRLLIPRTSVPRWKGVGREPWPCSQGQADYDLSPPLAKGKPEGSMQEWYLCLRKATLMMGETRSYRHLLWPGRC